MNAVQPRTAVSQVARASAVRVVDQNPHRIATSVLLVYLFILTSRGVEFIPVLTGANLHLTLLLAGVLLLAQLFTGQLLRTLRTPVVCMFSALTVWFLATTVTSQWRGGSAQTLLNYWFATYVAAMVIPGLISTVDQCRKALYAVGMGLVAMLVMTAFFETQVMGRDKAAFGTLGNPNDLAFSLLLLMPFAVFVVRSESLFNWKALLSVAALAVGLVRVLRTGSRSGMLTIVIVYLIVFLAGALKTKARMLLVAGLVVVVCSMLVSKTVLLRYATIFNGTSAEAGMSSDELSAVESTAARQMLFKESVRLMWEHPLFGVGPGIFSAALAGEQKERGEFQTWHEAHNSFTQMGSEAGFPALGLYLGVILYCLWRMFSLYRQTHGDPNQVLVRRMAASLAVAMIIFVICAFFGTYSYTFHCAVVAGLIQALDLSVQKKRSSLVPSAATPPLPSQPYFAPGPPKGPSALTPEPVPSGAQPGPVFQRPGMSALQRRQAETLQRELRAAVPEAVSLGSTDVRNRRIPDPQA